MRRVQDSAAVMVKRRLTAHDGHSGRTLDSKSLILVLICCVLVLKMLYVMAFERTVHMTVQLY